MAGDIFVSFGADTGELQAAFALAKAETNSLSREIATLAREMVKTGQSADSALRRELSALGSQMAAAKAHMGELADAMRHTGDEAGHSGFAQLREVLLGLTSPLAAVRNNLGEIAEAFAAAYAFEKISEFVKQTAEAAETIERQAQILGTTTTQVQLFRETIRLTGGDADQAVTAMARMAMRMADVGREASPLRRVLEAVHVDIKQFSDAAPLDRLKMLAEAFSKFAHDGASASRELEAAQLALSRSGYDLIPYLNKGAKGFEELANKIRHTGVLMEPELVGKMAEVNEKSKLLGDAVDGLGVHFVEHLAPDILVAMKELIGFLHAADELFNRPYMNNGKMELLAPGGIENFPLPGLNSAFGKDDPALKAWASGHGRDITVNKRPPPFPAIPEVGGGGRGRHPAGGEAREQYSDEIDAAKRAADETQDILNNEVKLHKISWDQWAKDSVAALEKEKAAVIAANNQAWASTALTSLQKQEIARKEADVLAEIAKKERDDQTKAAEEAQKAWQKVEDMIAGQFSSAFDGLVKGTETVSQAFKKMAISIGEDLAKLEIKKLVEGAGSGLQGALSGGGGGAAVAGGIGSLFSMSLPFLPFLDSGSWEIPHDTLAMVHQGEMVVPASGGVAESFRQNIAGASSGETHIHIHALDTQSGAAWLKNNHKGVVDAVRHGVKQGSHL